MCARFPYRYDIFKKQYKCDFLNHGFQPDAVVGDERQTCHKTKSSQDLISTNVYLYLYIKYKCRLSQTP